MRPTSGDVVAFIRSGRPIILADLFTFTLANGQVYRWTSSDAPITFEGITWTADGPAIDFKSQSDKITLEVPELSIEVSSNASDLLAGSPFMTVINDGGLDNCAFELATAYLAGDVSPVQVIGTVLYFAGRVSTCDGGSSVVQITIKGGNNVLNQQMPRNLYQAGCVNSLYSTACGANRAANTAQGAVGAGATVLGFGWANVPASPTDYSQGSLVFTSGVLNGTSRTIKTADANGITLAYPLPAIPAAGDAFTVVRGCSHTQAACARLGGNFRGFPFIPAASTAY